MSKYWSKTGKLVVFVPSFEIEQESWTPNKRQLKKLYSIILSEFERRRKKIIFTINKMTTKYPALIELTNMMIIENSDELPRFVVRGTRVFDETVEFTTEEKHKYGKILKEAFDYGYRNLRIKVVANAEPRLACIRFDVYGQATVP